MSNDLTNQLSTAPRIGLHAAVRWLRQKLCRHQFRYDDLQLTGIKPAEKPASNAPYKEQEAWFINRYTEDAFTKRVSWRCYKCGRVFYAHCGLDIFRHGKVMPPNAKAEAQPRQCDYDSAQPK